MKNLHPSQPQRTALKTAERKKTTVSEKTVIDRLVAKHELTELEASWLLKAWQLDAVSQRGSRFGCYLAGFMAGMAMKTVEHEIKRSKLDNQLS
jgi:hypothetical protein